MKKQVISAGRKVFMIILFVALVVSAFAQDEMGSDELFQKARTAAFDKKDYPLAIALSQKALKRSQEYIDIRVFLWRVYTWSDKVDSARMEFLYVIKQQPDYEDVYVAITDLEYWNNNPDTALDYCNLGLQYHPLSHDLLLRKAKILKANKKYVEAYQAALEVLQNDPANVVARSLINDIKDAASRNKVTFGYNFTWFDSNYSDYLHKSPWQILDVNYTRFTSLGSVTGRVNYGKRFGNTAFQFEMDAYPRICKGLYAYVNLGISDTSAVFPRYRAGCSLYASLPYSFEVEAGFRWLHFSGSTWIYVGSLSKYYRNFWFSTRITIVPDVHSISHSYTGIIRYYLGGADDYLHVSAGYGISPDDANSVLAYNNGTYKLISKSITMSYKRSIKKMNIISLSASLLNQEYRVGQKGNQVTVSISYQRRF